MIAEADVKKNKYFLQLGLLCFSFPNVSEGLFHFPPDFPI